MTTKTENYLTPYIRQLAHLESLLVLIHGSPIHPVNHAQIEPIMRRRPRALRELEAHGYLSSVQEYLAVPTGKALEEWTGSLDVQLEDCWQPLCSPRYGEWDLGNPYAHGIPIDDLSISARKRIWLSMKESDEFRLRVFYSLSRKSVPYSQGQSLDDVAGGPYREAPKFLVTSDALDDLIRKTELGTAVDLAFCNTSNLIQGLVTIGRFREADARLACSADGKFPRAREPKPEDIRDWHSRLLERESKIQTEIAALQDKAFALRIIHTAMPSMVPGGWNGFLAKYREWLREELSKPEDGSPS